MITSWESMQDIVYSDDYHCEHFVVDAMLFLAGIDISPYMFTGQGALPLNLKNFKKRDEPKQFTVVLMRDKNKAHVGLWYDNAVLHLSDRGVVHQPHYVASRGFPRTMYLEVTDEHI